MTLSDKIENANEVYYKGSSKVIDVEDIAEFIQKLRDKLSHQIVEWEMYEKRFPHKETKWNRLNSRFQKIINELAGSKFKEKGEGK
jgi:predicted nuclease with TOPRIM domain